jgi:hypothetical protein
MRVASSCPLLDLADAGRGTCEAQVAQAATSDPFKKDLLDISFVMMTPRSFKMLHLMRVVQHITETLQPKGLLSNASDTYAASRRASSNPLMKSPM